MSAINEQIVLANADETSQLGIALARRLRTKPALVFLSGEIGLGKTTLAQSLIKELAQNAHHVQSPTYAYMNSYRGHFPIFHFDLYRIESPETIFELGLYDHLTDPTALRLVEWPQHLMHLGKTPDLHITLTNRQQHRTATLTYFPSFDLYSLTQKDPSASSHKDSDAG